MQSDHKQLFCGEWAFTHVKHKSELNSVLVNVEQTQSKV